MNSKTTYISIKHIIEQKPLQKHEIVLHLFDTKIVEEDNFIENYSFKF